MELMSPQSGMQEIYLMFPAQTGKTTVIDTVAKYYIVEHPSEILYVTANAEKARTWFEKRIEIVARESGITFRAQTDDKNARRSGDRMYSKQFDGGDIDLASAQSAAALASDTKRIVFGDEITRWKRTLGDEGATLGILRARMQAWGDQKKMLLVTTPGTYEDSIIWDLFQLSTQEYYYVPCPFCKKLQTLDHSEGKKHGLHWHTDYEGKIDRKSIVYVCEHCHREIPESKKHWMLQLSNGAKWISTGHSKSEFTASFHINGIYSPFISWFEMATEYDESRDDPEKKQTYENLKMGRPFKDTGSRPKLENVISLRGTRKSGEVPFGVLYLTMAIDVQRGSKKDPQNPPRLEFEVLGHGSGYRTWSIDYIRIEGDIDDPFSGAWEKLNEWALDGKTENRTGLNYRRSDGHIFHVMMVFIDAGNADDIDDNGEHLDTVFRFAERWGNNVFAIKGFNSLKKRKKESGDTQTADNIKRFRATKTGSGEYIYYQISTNYYKNRLYSFLKVPRTDGQWQRPGFQDFPADYPDNYFDMLTAEEKRSDGSFHGYGRRNESGDCRVYNFCAGDVYLENYVRDIQLYFKAQGYGVDHIAQINTQYALEQLARETRQELISAKPPGVARVGK
jgi:phage terminase large subunit GpA-like protein